MGCGTLAALGLSAAGTGVNEYANSQIRGRMNNLIGQEMQRNKAFQKQGQDVFNDSFAQSTPGAARNQIQQGQQHLAGLVQNAQALPLTSSLPSISTVNDSDSNARTNLSDRAMSNFGGYSNFGQQQSLKDREANSKLGLISNQAQQWANILPTQLQQAQQSEGGLQALGSLLGVAGMLTGIGSLAAAPASTATAAQYEALSNGFGPVTAASAPSLAGLYTNAGLTNQLGSLFYNPATLYFY